MPEGTKDTHATNLSASPLAHIAPSTFATAAASLLGALANTNRLAVLAILNQGEKNVGDLSKMVGISQSALSQHLTKLKGANLVSTRREGQMIFYSSNSPAAILVLRLLHEFFPEA